MSLDVEAAFNRQNKSPNSLVLTVGKRTADVPPGQYQARIVEIQAKEFFGKNKRQLEFTFEIAEGEFQEISLLGFANAHYTTFTPFTKLYRWYSIAAEEEPDEGEIFDLNILFDKIFLVEVDRKKSRKTGNPFSNVTEILSLVCEI